MSPRFESFPHHLTCDTGQVILLTFICKARAVFISAKFRSKSGQEEGKILTHLAIFNGIAV